MSESLLPAIRDALHAELPWDTRGSLEASRRHSERLLAALHADLDPWWHDFRHDFRRAETDPNLLPAFRTALERLLSLPAEDLGLVGTIDLQAMARAALRLGAWRLLHALLGALLHALRSACPTPQRLSRATGLVAEWALAAGTPKTAILYSHESLSWGAEPHRIRSYLAYAKTLDSLCDRSPRDDLDLLLSLEATRRQPELVDRAIFGELHAFRIECLRQSASPGPRIPPLPDALRHPSPRAPSARALALAASDALAAHVDPSSPLSNADEFLPGLVSSGRWRDRVLISLACPRHACPELPLSNAERTFVASLDELAGHFGFPPPGPVDASLISPLPETIGTPDPDFALRRLLCCI